MAQQRLGDVHVPQGVYPQGHRQPQGQELPVHRRQDILVGGVGGGDAQVLPLLQLRQGVRLRNELLPALGQRQELLPRLRQLDAALPLAPYEQRRAHSLLQRPQTHGQRGLCDEQRLRRGGQRAVLHHSPERLQVGLCQKEHHLCLREYQLPLIFYTEISNFTSHSFCATIQPWSGKSPPFPPHEPNSFFLPISPYADRQDRSYACPALAFSGVFLHALQAPLFLLS